MITNRNVNIITDEEDNKIVIIKGQSLFSWD